MGLPCKDHWEELFMRRGRHGILNTLVLNFGFAILIWFHYFRGLIFLWA